MISIPKNIFHTSSQEKGAASIFVVIFFTILIGVVTVSFVRIVNNDQQQALNNDLSQSAYDASQAGVEDAKRTLDLCLQDKPAGCKQSLADQQKFTGEGCKDTDKAALQTESEVSVGQSAEDAALNQAYTCVNIDYFTDDYENELKGQGVDIIPLDSAPGQPPIGQFDLSWFTKEDAGGADSPQYGDAPQLPVGSSQWGVSKPALMRLQIIEAPQSGDIATLNTSSRALFLYPNDTGKSTLLLSELSEPEETADPGRRIDPDDGGYNVVVQKNQPILVQCANNFNDTFACKLRIGGLNTDPNVKKYLVISPIYANVTHFNITLDGTQFNGVQPKIDSTGRADDVFRRVQTRVRFDTSPIGGLSFDSADSICKAFGVTEDKFIDGPTSCLTRP